MYYLSNIAIVDNDCRTGKERDQAEFDWTDIQKSNFSQLSVVTTHGSTVPMLNATYLAWNNSLESIQGISGVMWSISLEPLPPAIYARAAAGSNALGLSNRSESLVVTVLSAAWTDEKDDALIEEAARALFDCIEDEAKKLEAYDPFVYLNYAAPWQKPLFSYGEESVERMERVRTRVDPKWVFTRQVPGGFKLKD